MMNKFTKLFYRKVNSGRNLALYLLKSTGKNIIFSYRVKKFVAEKESQPAPNHRNPSTAIYFINLDHRKDRLRQLEENFRDMNVPAAIRVPGNLNINGALGCALSHIHVLETFLHESRSELLLVAEDDCRLRTEFRDISDLLSEFKRLEKLQVLVICPSVQGRRIAISADLDVSNNIQTTACYVVKRNFVPKLLENFKEAAQKLESGISRNSAAIDINWKTLQQGYLFAIPVETLAFQASSYSDIEGTVVNYEPDNRR